MPLTQCFTIENGNAAWIRMDATIIVWHQTTDSQSISTGSYDSNILLLAEDGRDGKKFECAVWVGPIDY